MASKNTSFHDGPLAGVLLSPLKLAFSVGLGLVAILLVAWSIDWMFVSRVRPDGVDRLHSLLAADLGHGISLAARQGRGAGEITGPANLLYGLVFEVTGIHDMGLRFAEPSALSIPDTVVRRSYLANREAIETAMVGTQLLGVRFATFMRFLPLLLLLYAVGAADGLTERAIRRSCGGRESASLYHRAKYLQMVALGLGGVALLVWPGPVAWELCAGLIVILTAWLARQQWGVLQEAPVGRPGSMLQVLPVGMAVLEVDAHGFHDPRTSLFIVDVKRTRATPERSGLHCLAGGQRPLVALGRRHHGSLDEGLMRGGGLADDVEHFLDKLPLDRGTVEDVARAPALGWRCRSR